jgi:lipoprotein NlpD
VATATTTPPITYRVKRGDTLTTIAHHFHVAISAIASANHVANPDRLTEGQALRIPPAPPVKLVVTPRKGHAGQDFQFELTGAIPSETIKFEIDSSTGKYTGGPHTASADGAVTATYQPALTDPTGIYNVTATGNQGTRVRAGFLVVAAASTANT